ncbi:MAG: sterol desaturase family protein [Rhizobiales bacterium]|nr:sterol desaturase family protein [Hyphomicrobiales bacterium]
MAVTETPQAVGAPAKPVREEWNWHPELPIGNSPVFDWPPRPVAAFRWFAKSWLRISEQSLFAVAAVIVWVYFQPALELCKELSLGWIAQVYVRNLVLMFVVAGGLHLYFISYKKQGKKLKYDLRDTASSGRSFTFNRQVWDNMFWSVASGVTQWTCYEVLMLWSFANGYAPFLNWSDNPALFLAWFIIIPIWASFHFYWIHRLLHWPPLYQMAHALHHRNTNVGPWSGLSMHPLEHLIYLSSVLIHLVIASHPIHVLFHMYFNTLGAATTHTGYEGMLVKDKNRLNLGSFHHQLHHRYFECNYGNQPMPWDKWFGSFHDGTPEATERVRERRRRMHGMA